MNLEEIIRALPIEPEDADALVAEGIAAVERGEVVDQEDLFARWQAKYG